MQELVLELKNIEKSYNGKTILSIDDLKVYQNERIGIVGDNGQGKSTLLKLINQSIEPDKGQVRMLTDFQFYSQIEEETGLFRDQVDPEMLSRLNVPKYSTDVFSGGERTRARLARLFSRYTLGMLMDEPTTHLDSEGIQFLIDELTYYYGTLLIVSHDRYFLDQVVETIWEVKDGTVAVYPGNYTEYVEQKAQNKLEAERKQEAVRKEKARLELAVKKKHEQAQKMSKVSHKQKNRNIRPSRLSSSKQKDTVQKAAHKTAKSIEKRMEQIEDVDLPAVQRTIQFPEVKTVEIHNPYPVMLENVTIIRGDQILLEEVDAQFERGKRIAITGHNGAGKSSLLSHILNKEEGVRLSPKVRFAVYRQMDYKLAESTGILDYLLYESEYSEPLVRAVLNNLGFDQSDTDRAVSNLSGGEATRLAIAKLFTDPSNIIVLDEPTNFIDLSTIEALEHLLRDYKGTVFFTSHDKYFVDRVADQVWEINDQKLYLK
ncbi:ribosomal protection-like ABC-F family protein [Alkalibacterium sp. MB6]|nr:ABC-F type ribosomal protection protein [Alkalibacterium sp. MB6]